ncbi:MAG TPA: rhomboid family intramembrane serine protease [Pilimelia sp.]|nr:rhomboid family intramembrane serine protease [Pilimelia sp.]
MVIPVHDSVPVRQTPWVTYTLIGANVLIFLLTPAASSAGVEGVSVRELCQLEAFYDRYGAIPAEMLDNRQLPVAATGEVGAGQRGVGCVVGRPAYEKIPVVSVLYAMFLHGSWLHLLGNMLFLWVFGNNVEDRLGRLRYLVFYLFCGYVAAYGFALANADSTEPLVGASGAVSGVLGAYLVFFPRARIWSLVPILLFLPLRLPAWLVLGLWFGLQWFYSAGYATSQAGSVAYLAHVLGFIAGVLAAIPFLKRRPPYAYHRRQIRRTPPAGGWNRPP